MKTPRVKVQVEIEINDPEAKSLRPSEVIPDDATHDRVDALMHELFERADPEDTLNATLWVTGSEIVPASHLRKLGREMDAAEREAKS